MLTRSYILMFASLLLVGCSKGAAPGNQPAAAPSQVENATGASANTVTRPSNESPRSAGDSEWKTFTPPESTYSVLLPGAAQLFPTDDQTIKNYGIELPGGYVYMVSESVRPGPVIDAAVGLAALRDAQVGGNKLLFDDETSSPIGPGRDFGFVDQDSDAWHVRAFVKGNTVYQLITLAPGAAFSRDDPSASKFFESFKLLSSSQGNASTGPTNESP